MELLIIALIFVITYVALAAIGHYFVYTAEEDELISSAMNAQGIKSPRVFDHISKNTWEVCFVIDDKLNITPVLGTLDNDEAQQFKRDFFSESVNHLTLLYDVFNSEDRQISTDALKKFPSRVYFLKRRWSVKTHYDAFNRLLYIFMMDESFFSSLAEETLDLAGIYESDRTSVLDRIDEFIIKSRNDAYKKASSVEELSAEFVRRLRLLVIHISDMDLSATSSACVELTNAVLEHNEKTILAFLEEYSEERCLAITHSDRARFKNAGRNGGDLNILKMEILANLDSYFEGASKNDSYQDILLVAKKALFSDTVSNFVNTFKSSGASVNRKLNSAELHMEVNNAQMSSFLTFMPYMMPVVESLIMHPSQAPSERYRSGKSEYISLSISVKPYNEGIKVYVRMDGDCISEKQVSEITAGRYIRSNDTFAGVAVHDESKTIPHFNECLNALKQKGGRTDFEVSIGSYTELIFTVPVK